MVSNGDPIFRKLNSIGRVSPTWSAGVSAVEVEDEETSILSSGFVIDEGL